MKTIWRSKVWRHGRRPAAAGVNPGCDQAESVPEPHRLGRAAVAALQRFTRADGGAAAVEFALLSFPFLLLTVAFMDVGLVTFQGTVMEAAAQRVGREIRTGKTQTKYNQVVAKVAAENPAASTAKKQELVMKEMIKYMTDAICVESAPVACDNLSVDVRNYTSYQSSSSVPAPVLDSSGKMTNAVFQPTGPENVVVVRIVQPYEYVTGMMLSAVAPSSGHRYLLHTVLLHTEPFQ